jgi:hypothetical protein
MSSVFNIGGRAFTALALLALNLPGYAAPICRCCSSSDLAAQQAKHPAGQRPSCCSKAHVDTPQTSTTGHDYHSHSSTPRDCSKHCSSLCCLGKPTFQLGAHLGAEFLTLAPVGLIFAQPGEQPAAPFLDGLLRPPRI